MVRIEVKSEIIKKEEPMLSAIQVMKGLSKKYDMFLTVLVGIKEGKVVKKYGL